jgi:hypothetical protein
MSEPTVPVADTRVLVMSRRRSAGVLLGCAAFTAMGALWISYDFAFGWALAGFFGIVAIPAMASLVRPPTLRLDREGFTVCETFRRPRRPRRPRRRRWADCSPFLVWRRGKRQRLGVVYVSHEDDRVLWRVFNILLAGGDESIPLGFGGLRAEELAELLNGYRFEAVGEDEEYRFLKQLQGEAQRPEQGPGLGTRVLHGSLLWLGLVGLGVAYVTFRVDGPVLVAVSSSVVAAALFIAYVWWVPT